MRAPSGLSARGPRLVLAVAALGVLAIAAPTVSKMAPRLVWNASSSVPVGFYFVSRATLREGELVLAEAPKSVRDLAAARGYLPRGVPLAKRISANSGDEICAVSETISVNGAPVAERQLHDKAGRKMPSWTGCRVLRDEVFLLLPEVKSSFDGRYFGPVSTAAVIGKLTPLWTKQWPPAP